MPIAGEYRYLVGPRRVVVPIQYCSDGLWRSVPDGIIYAVWDDESADPVHRCGFGPFFIPIGNPLDGACIPHDYAYSSRAYQSFHTRKEADLYLRDLLALAAGNTIWRIAVIPFYRLARLFGRFLWENRQTNN